MADVLKLYKGNTLVDSAERGDNGKATVKATGLTPNTDIPVGEYKLAWEIDGVEGPKVDSPAAKTKPIAVTGVTISPKTSSAEAGTAANRQLTSTVAPTNATNKAVSYAISPTTTGLTVSGSGLIAWTAVVPAGAYTTTVTTSDGSKKDTHVLTLTQPDG